MMNSTNQSVGVPRVSVVRTLQRPVRGFPNAWLPGVWPWADPTTYVPVGVFSYWIN